MPRSTHRRFALPALLLTSLASAVLVLSLQAQVATPPDPPVVVSPADGATGVGANPMLCAAVSDPDGGNLGVTFQGREITGGPTPNFTIVALPDTQFYAQSFPQTFTAQTQWIADNTAARNISFVTQLGDCTQDGDQVPAEWTNANAAFSILENAIGPMFPNGMPYGIAVGNHDQTPIGTPRSVSGEGATTLQYNQTFGVGRFQGRGYYGGHYGANNDNHFELFSAGGMDFINLALEYDPGASAERTAVLDWADGVLKTHAQRRAIITSHYILNPNGTFGNQGQAIYDALKDNPNLFLMLCGHLDQAARRSDSFSGSTVHTLLSDYQTQPNGGNGWLRILTFSPDNDTISVQTYSPTLNQNLTNDPNQFTLAYDMQGGLPFRTIGTVSAVPSGSTACTPWPGRAAGSRYEWFATASDGTTQTAGAHATFTSAGTCNGPADCDDGNACTTDTCVTGTCTHSAIANCCNVASDCNDGNACTADTCAATNAAALSFDGSGDSVDMGAAPGLGAAQFTVEFWMKRTGAGTTANTGTGGFFGVPLVTKGVAEVDNRDNRDMNYFVGINDAMGGVIGADFEEGATGASPSLNHPVFGATPIPLNAWTHVAATYDGTAWRLYVNGNSDGSLVVGQPPRADSIQHFALGSAIDSTGVITGAYIGVLDEVRVWRRALTQAEILAGMNTQNVSDPDLVGHFGLNEAGGSVAGDSAPPAQNGAIVGASWVTANLANIGPGACSAAPIAGCCAINADCDDGNACTMDACNNGLCGHVYSPVSGCCSQGSQCDDGNSCTDDACVDGTCSNAAGASCCLNNNDCEDGNACTTGLCSQPDAAALAFDGSTGQVTMGPAPGLGVSTFTLETWFKWNGGGVATSTGTGGITAYPLVAKGRAEADGTNQDMNYFLGIDGTTSRLTADFEEGATGASPGLNHPIAGSTTITTGVWHHAAVTYDGACWKLYLDGVAETLTGTACPARPPRADSAQHFSLATALDSTGTAAGRFNGALDEVRLWNFARSAIEIQTTRDATITSAPGLVARYGLDEGTGNTAGNSTSDSNPGTLSGGTTWLTSGLPALGNAQCSQVPISGCCNTDAECGDGLACTADACVNHACQHAPIANCCTTNAECADADNCTSDACVNNVCTHATVCCSTAAQCDDGNSCTTDTCSGPNAAALTFDGTNDYVTMGSTTALGAATFTLETWVRWTGGGAGTSTGTGGIASALPLVSKGRAEAEGSNVDMNYFLGIDTATGRLAADFEEGPFTGGTLGLNHPITGTTAVTQNVWHHAAVTYDGSCWKIYLDGAAETLIGTACPARPPRFDSIQHFGLGTAMTSTGVAAGFFKGNLDEVRVWKRALTQSEIQGYMNTQSLPADPDLLGHWNLNEGSLTTANDTAPPAQNGTLTNGPTWLTTGLVSLGQCAHSPAPDGTSCSDGNACTQTDSCQSGVCVGTDTVVCNPSDQCHDAGVCDPSTGLCSNPQRPDGTLCEDGSRCTQNDVCRAGQCTPGSSPTCDDNNPCTSDRCDPLSGCSHGLNNNAPCEDGNACTVGDICFAGACTGGKPVACSAPDQCHMAGVCDPQTGLCSNPLPQPDGYTCDDGNACTSGDRCRAGTCTPLGPTNCDDNNPCTDDACVAPTGCTYTNNTATCDDGDVCNGTGVCQDGSCVGSPPLDCDDHNPCTDDFCDAVNGCRHTDNTASCDDGNACTTGDTCRDGTCRPQGSVVCTALDQCHDAGVCDTATGVCSNPPRPDNTPCSDGNACTAGDVCRGGTCTPTGNVVCQALDQCHEVGVCNPATGVCSNPVRPDGSACDDGSACTLADQCRAGQCIGDKPVLCSPLDQCHVTGACDPSTGECSNPPAPDGTACDDGNACTTQDQCVAGACGSGTAPPETCNGLDDNCDGSIDEGNPGGGQPCATGQPGVCGVGVTLCSGGAIVCVATSQPSTPNVAAQIDTAMKYRPNASGAAVEDAVLVQLDSSMRYHANSADPGVGLTWTAEAFDDSGWTSGTYGVGYDTAAPPNALALIRTTVPAGTFSVFTRATFSLADASIVRNLFFGADYDDGYVAYLNGVEVTRSTTMPAGNPAWNSNAALHESSNAATPNYGTPVDLSAFRSLLHDGPNVLAVGVWNSAAATSTDLVVVPRLSIGFDWTASTYDDAGWVSGTYGTGYDTAAAPNALALIRTSVPAGTLSVFTRVHFNVPDAAALAAIQKITLGADYDDGAVAWINGVEVLGTAEMPFGALTPATPAALHESSNAAVPNYTPIHDITVRALPALVVGDNVLAVGVWNSDAASTDLVVVPRLALGEGEACDGLDNDCNGIVDDGFPDADHDGRADCVDPDDDNDGSPDTQDCRPDDASGFAAPPAEVQGVAFARADWRSMILTWADQGAGLTYDVAGGLVAQLRTDGGTAGAACLPGGQDLGHAFFDDTRAQPATGEAYYYMVRSQNAACGAGTYGYASSGAEHLPASACP